jgi:hypothetical protein
VASCTAACFGWFTLALLLICAVTHAESVMMSTLINVVIPPAGETKQLRAHLWRTDSPGSDPILFACM